MPIGVTEAKPTLDGAAILMHGNPKTGKSTGAASFPDHIFLFTEQGANYMTGARRWEDKSGRYVPKDLDEFKKAYEEVKAARPRWLIIDTIDRLVDLLADDIVARTPNAKDLNDGPLGYGKGVNELVKATKRMCNDFISLPCGVILVSHSYFETVEPRVGESFSRAIPSVQDNKKQEVLRSITSQMEMILYLDSEGDKTRVRSQPSNHWVAGARGNIKIDQDKMREWKPGVSFYEVLNSALSITA